MIQSQQSTRRLDTIGYLFNCCGSIDQKPEEHAPKPAKKSSVPVATLSIFLLASLAAGAWYVLVYQRVDNNFPPDETPALSSTEHSAATLTPQPEQEPTNPLPEEPLSSVKDTPLQVPPVKLSPQQQCDQLSNKLSGFFTHLDQEPYIKDFKLNLPVADHFNQLTVKLLANPPVVTRESDDRSNQENRLAVHRCAVDCDEFITRLYITFFGAATRERKQIDTTIVLLDIHLDSKIVRVG